MADVVPKTKDTTFEIGDDYIIAKGKFPDADKLYVKYKKGRDGYNPLACGVTMTDHYDAETGYTKFSFHVAVNAVEDAIADGKIIGKITHPLHPAMLAYFQTLLDHAICYWEQVILCHPKYATTTITVVQSGNTGLLYA